MMIRTLFVWQPYEHSPFTTRLDGERGKVRSSRCSFQPAPQRQRAGEGKGGVGWAWESTCMYILEEWNADVFYFPDGASPVTARTRVTLQNMQTGSSGVMPVDLLGIFRMSLGNGQPN